MCGGTIQNDPCRPLNCPVPTPHIEYPETDIYENPMVRPEGYADSSAFGQGKQPRFCKSAVQIATDRAAYDNVGVNTARWHEYYLTAILEHPVEIHKITLYGQHGAIFFRYQYALIEE